jgi:hypothetical protein
MCIYLNMFFTYVYVYIVNTTVVKFLTVILSTDNIDVSAESLGHKLLSRAFKDIISHSEILSLLYMKLTSYTHKWIYVVMHDVDIYTYIFMYMMYIYIYVKAYIYTHFYYMHINVYICMDTYRISDTTVVKFLTVILSTDNIDVSAESLGHKML